VLLSHFLDHSDQMVQRGIVLEVEHVGQEVRVILEWMSEVDLLRRGKRTDPGVPVPYS
jgi:hypothetical protein